MESIRQWVGITQFHGHFEILNDPVRKTVRNCYICCIMTKEELKVFLENWENMELLFRDPEQCRAHFGLIMETALEGNDRVNWRASWAADKINDFNPGIASGWIGKMVETLPLLRHHGKKRQFLKMISLYPISHEQMSFLFEYCLERLSSTEEDVSVRVYSMQILYNISQIEPDLKNELLQIIEQEMEYRPSPGILTRGRKLASRLKKEMKNSLNHHTVADNHLGM